MKYVMLKSLACRSTIEQLPDEPLPEDDLVLKGEDRVLVFDGPESTCGQDVFELFPAVHRGQRAWLLRKTWLAARGYSAEGVEENVLGFEEGVKMLIKHDVFAFPKPAPVASR